jgi:hypothetical protein
MAEWDEMKELYRGPYIDAICQVWFHLVQLFQRSRVKYEKLTDGRRFSSSLLKPISQCEPNKVITKLPNTEQSSKGKGKTHKSTNRQNQLATENLENRNGPDLIQAFLMKWWVK